VSIFKPGTLETVKPEPVPTKPSAPPSDPKARVRGVDVSHHNESVDFKAMKAAGWHFAFMKATEAAGFEDSKFKARWAAAKEAGVMVGAYHFFRANVDPAKQAEHFISNLKEVSAGDLPPVMDWETKDNTERLTHIIRGRVFLEMVERATGRRPIIYTGPSFAGDFLKLPAEFAKYPLWVAHYQTKQPRVPAPWKTWTFWQDSETGVVPGVANRCDTNYFMGSIEDLKRLQ
jgi:lysozyme